MNHLGRDLAGVCLAEEYTLRRHLFEEDSGAFFEAVHNTGERSLIKLEPETPVAEERLALWRRTAYLQHPNLLRLLDCGRTEQGVYAAMEWPDDHLTDALAQGPLAEPEARDLLTAALDALRYLHAQGLIHGQVDAKHVWASGNSIKLSTDNLREPNLDETRTGESPYAGDLGALGALVYQVITGREFAGAVRDVPEPFATIVRNTAGARAGDRWRIPEILAALADHPVDFGPPLADARSTDMQVQTQSEALSASEPKPIPAEPVAAPHAESEAIVPIPRSAPPRIPAWAWPASLAAIVGCIAWVLHTPERKATPQPPAPVYSAPPNTAPPTTAPAIPPATAEPAPPTESAAQPERTVWRVIAYTYNALRDAQKKALAINRRWPGFRAEVFAPKGKDNPPYLVALGGRMNHMDAAKLLQKARSRGLPRDTFLLNFSD